MTLRVTVRLTETTDVGGDEKHVSHEYECTSHPFVQSDGTLLVRGTENFEEYADGEWESYEVQA